MTFTEAQWVEVTKSSPCPVCDHDGWCSIDATDGTVLCMRNASDEPVKSGGWLHRGNKPPDLPAPPKRQKSTTDWAKVAAACQARIRPEAVAKLAADLGVDPIALQELGVGTNGVDWTFPMLGPDGAVLGVRRRTPSGRKLAMKGAYLGLIRRPQPDRDETLIVCEGESDTAAMLSLGFDAVGLPGVGTCHDYASAYAIGRDVVVMLDADKAGAEATTRLVPMLLRTAKTVRVVRPPEGTKDARAWLNAGARREDFDAAIAAAPIEQEATAEPTQEQATEEATEPSPIELKWAAAPTGWLSRAPKPRRWLLRHPTKNGVPCPPGEGDGLLPRGKVGLLLAEGGAGKTMAVTALALSLITGRNWLDHFVVGGEARGRVLLALGEEDMDEVHRRLWSVCEAQGLVDDERRAIEHNLCLLPLAGSECGLLEIDAKRQVRGTKHYAALLKMLRAHHEGDGWALVVVDPLSRFSGVSIDLDNALATRVVQMLEALTGVKGNPTVIGVHHSSKTARREGGVDARGATALVDGVRWVAGMTAKDGGVAFQQMKSNYSAPMLLPLNLVRGEHGVLRVAQENKSATDQKLAMRAMDRRDRVVDVLRSMGGSTTSIRTVTCRIEGRPSDLCAAFQEAIAVGLISTKKVQGQRTYFIPAEGAEQGAFVPPKGGERPQAPPPFTDSGAAPPNAPKRPLGTDDEADRGADEGRKGAEGRNVDDGMPEQPKRRRRRTAGGAA